VLSDLFDLPGIESRLARALIRAGRSGLRGSTGLQPRLLGRHQFGKTPQSRFEPAEWPWPWIRPIFVRGVNTPHGPVVCERIGGSLGRRAEHCGRSEGAGAFLEELIRGRRVMPSSARWRTKQVRRDGRAKLESARAAIHFLRSRKAAAPKDQVDLRKRRSRFRMQKSTVAEAISYAPDTMHPAASTILICGSLYLIGEARSC